DVSLQSLRDCIIDVFGVVIVPFVGVVGVNFVDVAGLASLVLGAVVVGSSGWHWMVERICMGDAI
ncbi:MAG: hypothetical protein KDA62_19820, partial [Planctomycetales bacterium]|nr:hypothetical protein [Planctomycetales bacterium]